MANSDKSKLIGAIKDTEDLIKGTNNLQLALYNKGRVLSKQNWQIDGAKEKFDFVLRDLKEQLGRVLVEEELSLKSY